MAIVILTHNHIYFTTDTRPHVSLRTPTLSLSLSLLRTQIQTPHIYTHTTGSYRNDFHSFDFATAAWSPVPSCGKARTCIYTCIYTYIHIIYLYIYIFIMYQMIYICTYYIYIYCKGDDEGAMCIVRVA